jgi:alpha-1,3-glucanase-like protein
MRTNLATILLLAVVTGCATKERSDGGPADGGETEETAEGASSGRLGQGASGAMASSGSTTGAQQESGSGSGSASGAAVASSGSSGAALSGSSSASPSGSTGSSGAMSGLPPITCGASPTRGAGLPYQEYEAESGMTNGTVLGPSRAVNDANVFNSMAGESSGRMAVKLSASGQYVSFTSQCEANGIVVRYALPDSADGSGTSATLGLYVNGARVQTLNLTSHYAWAYGDPVMSTTTTNNPSDGYARHYFDETRLLLPTNIPAQATVELRKDDQDMAPYYVIDFIDLEQVPAAIERPANSLSITDYGATPNDSSDDALWIRNCINDAEAQGKIVWIPPGIYNDSSMPFTVQGVTIQGAGMWYSTIQGAGAQFTCGGSGCQFLDFSLSGAVTARDDSNSIHALGGSFGTGSALTGIWVEHYTTGPWVGVGNAAVTNGLMVHGCRFRDLFADGINLTVGTSNSVVEQTSARNTGDDAFASWSVGSSSANANNVFRFDTAQLPWRANCFAIYGGTSNSITDSVCTDVVTYPGIFINQGFDSTPFGGTTSVDRDTLLRAGGDAFGTPWGALTVSGSQASSAITGVQVQDVDIESSTFAGVYIVGPKDAIDGLSLNGVTIANPGTDGIFVDQTAVGNATATDVVVTGPGSGAGLNNQASASFTINRGPGNAGW